MARTPRPSVFVVGDYGHADFRLAMGWLHARVDIECAPNCAAALELLIERSHAPIEWLIFAAARRGRFHHREIDALHRVAPLARLLYLTGSWCEGETRSGKTPPRLIRVPWHTWLPRANAEFMGIGLPRYAGWHLSGSATAVDITLSVKMAQSNHKSAEVGGTVVIVAQTRADFESVADVVAASGHAAVWRRPNEDFAKVRASAILWNATSFDARLQEQLRDSASDEIPLILLLDAPRQYEVTAAIAVGVTAVVGKPFLLGDLQMQVGRAASLRPHWAA